MRLCHSLLLCWRVLRVVVGSWFFKDIVLHPFLYPLHLSRRLGNRWLFWKQQRRSKQIKLLKLKDHLAPPIPPTHMEEFSTCDTAFAEMQLPLWNQSSALTKKHFWFFQQRIFFFLKNFVKFHPRHLGGVCDFLCFSCETERVINTKSHRKAQGPRLKRFLRAETEWNDVNVLLNGKIYTTGELGFRMPTPDSQ